MLWLKVLVLANTNRQEKSSFNWNEKSSVMVRRILGGEAHPRFRHVGRAAKKNPRSRGERPKTARGTKKTRRRWNLQTGMDWDLNQAIVIADENSNYPSLSGLMANFHRKFSCVPFDRLPCAFTESSSVQTAVAFRLPPSPVFEPSSTRVDMFTCFDWGMVLQYQLIILKTA